MLIRILKLIISIFFLFYISIIKLITIIFRKELYGHCIVLYYHGIYPDILDKFDRQMAMLAKYTIPISVDDLENMKNGKRYSLVTFDDGFVSVAENALPILLKWKIPSIIFIPTNYIGKVPNWGNFEKKGLANDDKVINQEQIKKISQNSFITIGSHSETHCDFLDITDEQATKEISNSKRVLESIINTNIISFSFPHGKYSQKHVKICKNNGYKYIFSISPKPVDKQSIENIMGRFHVQPDEWTIEFYLKLIGAYCWLPFAFTFKKNIINMFLSETSK